MAKTIFVVDDSQTMLLSVKQTLEIAGFKVREVFAPAARIGADAFELTVADDGRGFEPGATPGGPRPGRGRPRR